MGPQGVRITITDRFAPMAKRPIPAVRRARAQAIDKDRFRPWPLDAARRPIKRRPARPYISGRHSTACRMRFDHDRPNDLARRPRPINAVLLPRSRRAAKRAAMAWQRLTQFSVAFCSLRRVVTRRCIGPPLRPRMARPECGTK